jgi:hypothetical protein
MKSRDKSIGAALAAATCGLLGAGGARAVAADKGAGWDIDSALLYYSESDGRVRDASLAVDAKHDFGGERLLDLSLHVDSLTGASPSGAIPADGPQTFTSPSGRKTYDTPAGEVPLDSSFHDTRFALDAGWSQSFARLYKFNAGLGFSNEFDYQHIGGNLGLSRDFDRRNTTLSAALAYGRDTIKPVGGVPVALGAMPDATEDDDDVVPGRLTGSDSKTVLDVLLGVTQVLGRYSLLRVNFSYSDSSGYLTDPYKLLSVVDPVTGELVARTPAPGSEGPLGTYRFEKRPDSRRRESLYTEFRHDFTGKVLQLSYRYATDDWEVDSHTLETRFRWPLGESNYLEPHLRYYRQSAASFYRYSLANTGPLPEFASADARLGELDSMTFGVKFGHRTPGGNEWNARLEFYRQTGSVPTDQLIGSQVGNAQLPDFNAVIVQVGYRFKL